MAEEQKYLILSTLLSREVNVTLLYGRYFEKEASYLSEILPGQLLRLYLNFYEYGMLIERELYFAAFLNHRAPTQSVCVADSYCGPKRGPQP